MQRKLRCVPRIRSIEVGEHEKKTNRMLPAYRDFDLLRDSGTANSTLSAQMHTTSTLINNSH